MDKVFIAGLEVLCTIGAYDWEKSLKQKLIFDLEMDYDNRPAGETDDLARALDYSCVASRVTALILREFAVPRVRVRVTKPTAVAAARGVGVEIVREA